MNKSVFRKIVLFMGICICLCFIIKGKSEAATSPYYIKVNKRTNVATVYKSKNNKPCKAILVSCGNATPTGTFYTMNKYRWRTLMGNCYGQYSTRITGSILFHSVWYYRCGDKSSLSIREYNKLGTTASHGCVRLNVEDAKWIYEKCNLKTKVIIFNGNSSNDLLGKPKLKKISTGKRTGWDPTDPDKKNPYNKVSYKGIEASNKTVQINKNVNVLKGVSAKTKGGRKLTSSIIAKIKEPGTKKYKKVNVKTYKLTKAGTYNIEYSVKDKKTGITKKKNIKYICKDPNPPIISGVMQSQNIEFNSIKELRVGVKAYNVSNRDLTNTIEVLVKKPNQSTYTKAASSTLVFDILGVYYVRYRIVNPDNKLETIKEVKLVCVDTKEPIIMGCKDTTTALNTEYNVRDGITAKTVSNIDLTNNISIQITSPTNRNVVFNGQTFVPDETGTYVIKYSVISSYGVRKEVIRRITVEEVI